MEWTQLSKHAATGYTSSITFCSSLDKKGNMKSCTEKGDPLTMDYRSRLSGAGSQTHVKSVVEEK